MMTETGATETTARAVEAQGWRTVRELQKAQEAAASVLREAQDSLERIEYLRERAEKEVREQARREVGAWAAGVKSDTNAVVLTIATTGLEDPVDVVEAVVLGMDGGVRFHERVRPVGHDGGAPVEIEAGATGMHGHTADSLSDAPTFEEVYERLRGALGDGRVIVYNDEYVLRVLTQTVKRYWLEPLVTSKIEDAMVAYVRADGEYSVESESYYPKKLPDANGTPLGNARATLALVEKLAAEHGGNGSGGKGQPLDIDESDWEDIPF